MVRYFMNQKQKNMSKDIEFCHLQKIYLINTGTKILDTVLKTKLDDLKNAFEKVFHRINRRTDKKQNR